MVNSMRWTKRGFSLYEIGITLVIIQILLGSWYIWHIHLARQHAAVHQHMKCLAHQMAQAAGYESLDGAPVWHVDITLGIKIINIGSAEDPWLIII